MNQLLDKRIFKRIFFDEGRQGRIIINAREVGFAKRKFFGDVVVVNFAIFTLTHLKHRALAQLHMKTLRERRRWLYTAQ